MKLAKLILSAALAVAAPLGAAAQDILPDAPAAQAKKQAVVKETAHLGALDAVLSVVAPIIAPSEVNIFGESAVKTAMQYLGCRYRHGAAGPTVFDCSGFTSFVYGKHNVNITRSSRGQYLLGRAVQTRELRAGDLVFFSGRAISRTVGHVGIVTEVDPETGVFSFVHAASSGVRVSKSTEKYYSCRYIGARRIVE